MKTPHNPAATFFLLVVLTSCTSLPKPAASPKLTRAILSTQTIQPTQIVIPTDVAFSTPLVQVMRRSGLAIMSVQSSTYLAMFPSSNKAVWIKTNEGIVEVIFFADPSEVEQIHITEQPNKIAGRYLYVIQALPPTLLNDQTIDAAYPLYFAVKNDMLMITSSEELDESLKYIFLAQ